MGIDLNGAQLLIRAQKSGVSFARVATLGRQRNLCDRQTLLAILGASGYQLTEDRVQRFLDPKREYAEEFLSILGAKDIFAIDASDFEGAQIVHDMNQPIPDALDSSFDVVIDGGTLEHIFNLPVALGNAIRMVRPDGRFVSLNQANNFCGHGFYQFSPELYYRFLCPENGYVMDSCILWEDIPGSQFFQVPDPDAVQDRINLTSEFGVYLYVQATRRGKPSREFIPQQSDYARLWEKLEANGDPPTQASGRAAKLKAKLKQIPALRTAVQSARATARYRSLNLRRNADGYLTALKDLKVIR